MKCQQCRCNYCWSASSSVRGQHLSDAAGRSEDDITLMLIVVVLVFVICQTPALATQLLLVILGDQAKSCSQPFFYYERLSDLMVVANSSVNFIIYCFCSRTFRQTVVEVLCRRSGRRQRQQLQLQQLQPLTARAAPLADAETLGALRVNLRKSIAADYTTTLEPAPAAGARVSVQAADVAALWRFNKTPFKFGLISTWCDV